MTEAQRDNQLKRLDGVATILAQAAAREPSLFSLLQDDAEITDATRRLQREMQVASGPRARRRRRPQPRPRSPRAAERRGPCRSRWSSAQLANPFLTPDFSQATAQGARVGWSAGS